MERWGSPARAALGLAALAAAVRLAFVAWAPRELSGDGLHYHMSAFALANGSGYTDLDGSPSIRWMPGWPLLLSWLYRPFGLVPSAGMALSALVDATVAGMLVLLGGRWFGLRAGCVAGLVYALWPGNVYYCATLMTEPLFNALLVAAVCALVASVRDRRRGLWWTALAGALWGSMALVKSEPLILGPVFAVFLWRMGTSRRQAALSVVVLVAVAAVSLAPWVVRNQQAFGRFLPTTATGGANAWLGNHPGASGGQAIVEMREFMSHHTRENQAETLFAASRAGWAEVGRYVQETPIDALRGVGRKLVLTYGSDAHGARLVRGVGVGRRGFLAESRLYALEWLANAYWYGVMALVAIGLLGLGGWTPEARVMLLGVPLSWLVVHVVFLGGPRFHVPESPVYALIAASGVETVARRVGWRNPSRTRAADGANGRR